MYKDSKRTNFRMIILSKYFCQMLMLVIIDFRHRKFILL